MLVIRDQSVRVEREFDAAVTVTAPNRGLCLHLQPEEAFYWTSWPTMDSRRPPFVLYDRHSEIKCLKPREAYVFNVSLRLSKLGDRYLLLMDGSEVGVFDDLNGIELGVTFHPVDEPFGSSYDGYSNWPKVALSVDQRAPEG